MITVKSPYSNTIFACIFKPSKYIHTKKSLWILISILGEKEFETELENNNYLVDEDFITTCLSKTKQWFYLSKKDKIIYSCLNEINILKHLDVIEIQLLELLNTLTSYNLFMIDEIFEKGEYKY